MEILRANGVEDESDLAFAGLHELLRPVLAHLGELPETQSRALAGALGLAPSSHPDRLLISAAVLGLLAAAAETRPLLCVVDDAQWVDRPSAEALVFTARRLQAEHLAILFGAREGETRRFEAARVPELELTGLSRPSAAAVLAAGRVSSLAPAVRDRLLAEADGNPLALLELPEGLSAAQLEGRAPLPEAIPLSPRLEGVFRQRVRRLPGATRTALLIAAADTSGSASAVLRAAAELRLDPDALDPAETAGLIRIADQTITFRHPLVRSALYQGATHSQRQRVHAALASAFTGDDHVDRRVWHQAMATVTGDEEVAAALEASAHRAELRAGHASAATAFLRAAELSTEEPHRVRRIAAAAGAAWHAGQPDRARAAIARALPLADGELRAQLLHLSGVAEMNTGSLPEAYTRLLEAAASTVDPSLRLEMLAEAFETAAWIGDFARVIEIADMMEPIVPVSARDRLMHAHAPAFAKIYAGKHTEGQACSQPSWSKPPASTTRARCCGPRIAHRPAGTPAPACCTPTGPLRRPGARACSACCRWPCRSRRSNCWRATASPWPMPLRKRVTGCRSRSATAGAAGTWRTWPRRKRYGAASKTPGATGSRRLSWASAAARTSWPTGPGMRLASST